MRVISEESVLKIINRIARDGYTESMLVDWLYEECHEFQEPWIPLDAFLKSGFEGWCFVCIEQYIILSNRTDFGFFGNTGRLLDIAEITHVMPIHKPEPPR